MRRLREITRTERHIVMTRHQVAAMLRKHPDTLTDLLRTDRAFAGCLIARGGAGREQTFDATLVFQWMLARQSPRVFAETFLERLAGRAERGGHR